MRVESELLRVLSIACRPCGPADDSVVTTEVDSAAAALVALRWGRFDVVLTTDTVSDGPVWPLAEKVRRVRPKLHWWLIARGITADQEILARTLGVTRILAAMPTGEQLAAGVVRPSTLRALVSQVEADAASAVFSFSI